MYLWDELEYNVHFISNESTEQQVQIASATVDKLEEPVYDHRMRIKERSRPLQKCNDNQPISICWEIGGIKAHCLIDSGCKGIIMLLRNNHDTSRICHSYTSLSFYHACPPVMAHITHVSIQIKGRLWSIYGRSHQSLPGPGVPTHSWGEGSSKLFPCI